ESPAPSTEAGLGVAAEPHGGRSRIAFCTDPQEHRSPNRQQTTDSGQYPRRGLIVFGRISRFDPFELVGGVPGVALSVATQHFEHTRAHQGRAAGAHDGPPPNAATWLVLTQRSPIVRVYLLRANLWWRHGPRRQLQLDVDGLLITQLDRLLPPHVSVVLHAHAVSAQRELAGPGCATASRTVNHQRCSRWV